MRRGLYTSNYTGIPAYLMDFGFGGFLGYGRRVSCCVGEEELKILGQQVTDNTQREIAQALTGLYPVNGELNGELNLSR